MATVYDNASLVYGTHSSIRLVELLPSPALFDREKHKVSCKFRVVPLASAPKYTAISYMWGQNTATVDIVLDEKRFAVRTNLYELLYTLLQDTSYPGLLWVDAICINQESIHERNHQVGLMGEIYSKAEGVVVWLGPQVSEVADAIDYLHDTARNWDVRSEVFPPRRSHTNSRISRPGPLTEEESSSEWYNWTPSSLSFWSPRVIKKDPFVPSHVLRRRVLLEYFERNNSSSQQLLALCTHPYWSRAWIVQELILAKDVSIQCGASRLHNIEDLASRLQGLRTLLKPGESQHGNPRIVRMILDSPAARLLAKRQKWRESAGRSYINPWDTGFGTLGCSDVRDRVYAMSALMDPKLGIVPDYNASPSELFEAIFEQNLQRTGAFFGPIWNLQHMLELGDDSPIVQRARQFGSLEWTPIGTLGASAHKSPKGARQ